MLDVICTATHQFVQDEVCSCLKKRTDVWHTRRLLYLHSSHAHTSTEQTVNKIPYSNSSCIFENEVFLRSRVHLQNTLTMNSEHSCQITVIYVNKTIKTETRMKEIKLNPRWINELLRRMKWHSTFCAVFLVWNLILRCKSARKLCCYCRLVDAHWHCCEAIISISIQLAAFACIQIQSYSRFFSAVRQFVEDWNKAALQCRVNNIKFI